MNTAYKLTDQNYGNSLKRVDLTLKKESQSFKDAFALLGWQQLPDALKDEIVMDVVGMVNELKGNYCSTDPFVEQRRRRVNYWVECYRQGICTLDTAVDALKIQ